MDTIKVLLMLLSIEYCALLHLANAFANLLYTV